MIVLDYVLKAESSRACINQVELRAPGFSLTRATHIGCRFFDHSNGANPRSREWAKLVVVVEGTMTTKLDGSTVELEPGAVLSCPAWASAPLFPVERDSVGVKLSWRVGALGARTDQTVVSRLSRPELNAVQQALAAVPTSDDDAKRSALAVASVLALRGVPIITSEIVRACDEIREVDRRFASAIAERVFPLARRTTLRDLARALYRGERQVVRMSNDFFRRYFASVRSYREFAAAWRVAGAFALLSRGTSVDAVAAEVGFSSSAALCHAFQRVGVPSPAVIQARYATP